jgi:MOSC domain-containing protein YiiM
MSEPEIRHSAWQEPAPEGMVVAVSVDGKHRFSKASRPSITLTSGHGIEGDAHCGPFVRHRYLARRNPKAPNLRQVHLISSELFDALRSSGFEVPPGDLGENIATVGSDLEHFPLGTILQLGTSATLELYALRPDRSLQVRIEETWKAARPARATEPASWRS